MYNKNNILSLFILFLLSNTTSIIAMLSKFTSTIEERQHTQEQNKLTALLLKEYMKPQINHQEISLLIQQGADVNGQNNLGVAPLHIACIQNLFSLVEQLIENDANVNIKENDGNTPLHIACEAGYEHIATLLIKNNANVNSVNNNEDTPLLLACEHKQFPIIKLLIENGANVNVKNKKGATPLHIACENNDIETIKFLIKNNADVNAINKTYHATPLHIACFNKAFEIANLLIHNGANINAQTIIGCTPLHAAVFANSKNICELLLSKNANHNLTMLNNITAADIACDQSNKDIIALFSKYGISTISAQQADKNMYNLFAELNEEKLQKKQKIAIQQQKKQAKQINQEKQKPASKRKNKRHKQLVETTTTKNIPETPVIIEIKKTLINKPIEEHVTITSPVITPSTMATPSIPSPTSPIPTVSSNQIFEATVITSPSKQNTYTIKEEPVQQQYLILIGEKLKWPQSLNTNQEKSIKEHLKQLKNWPNHGGLDVTKLAGKSNMYRLRVGGYRIIFSVDEKNHEIKIHEIGLRKNVYKNLKM